MVMPPCGTFEYVGVVPAWDAARTGAAVIECRMSLRTPVARVGDRLRDNRLVGHAPHLRITEPVEAAGPPSRASLEPAVARSHLTLRASSRADANMRAASVEIARDVVAALRPGDVLHLARTPCAGLGLSVLRDGRLVVAIGAVGDVPLGPDVQVTVQAGYMERSRWLTQRWRAGVGSDARDRELDVEVRIDGHSHTCPPGRLDVREYVVHVHHGYRIGLPGEDECIAIVRPDACPVDAAIASALLLEHDRLHMQEW